MTTLYPLKFKPILQERIWGGTKLTEFLKKSAAQANIGESWELSALPDADSIVSNGFLSGNTLSELIEIYMGELVGEGVYQHYGSYFPLLFKIIDAHDKLSIQVHPNDEIAAERHNSFGKTEMWYVMDAEPNAEIIVGFKEGCSQNTYINALDNNTVEDVLERLTVSKGDVVFIPAGIIHAIGKGILLAEIQQSSDITYRIYDYNRVDVKGDHRQLHIDEALGVIDFNVVPNPKTIYNRVLNEIIRLVTCDYFTCNLIFFDTKVVRLFGDIDSFKVYMCTEGFFNIVHNGNYTPVNKGETVLIPASIGEITLIPVEETTVLEVFAGRIELEN